MKVKCNYCESYIDDFEDVCPNCGAVNENMKRMANGIPTTIEELKRYCVDKNLPITKMRFYIGENYKLPKAFGIYKDETSGDFVVYKNKSDGSRMVRYQGTDEAYAVNEIYQKLQAEVLKQRARQASQNQNRSTYNSTYSTSNNSYYEQKMNDFSSRKNSRNKHVPKFFLIFFVIMFGSSILEFIIFGIVGLTGNVLSGSSSYDYSYDYDYDYDYDYSGGSDWDSSDTDYDYDDNYDDDDWDTDWDSGWDDSWDSDWDSDWGSDWDSDW